jgi:hypothetical protein
MIGKHVFSLSLFLVTASIVAPQAQAADYVTYLGPAYWDGHASAGWFTGYPYFYPQGSVDVTQVVDKPGFLGGTIQGYWDPMTLSLSGSLFQCLYLPHAFSCRGQSAAGALGWAYGDPYDIYASSESSTQLTFKVGDCPLRLDMGVNAWLGWHPLPSPQNYISLGGPLTHVHVTFKEQGSVAPTFEFEAEPSPTDDLIVPDASRSIYLTPGRIYILRTETGAWATTSSGDPDTRSSWTMVELSGWFTPIPKPEEDAIAKVQAAQAIVDQLPPDAFSNKNSAHALGNKMSGVLVLIHDHSYQEALNKLSHDILPKMNGCAESGQCDSNDWIVTCDSQARVYPLIQDAISLLTLRLTY